MLLLKIDHVGHAHLVNIYRECALASCHIRIRDLFLVTTLRYAASDDFNYLRGCLTLLPSVFSWAPGNTDHLTKMS